MSRRSQLSMRTNLFFLFLVLLTTIIGATESKVNPYIACIIAIISFLGIVVLVWGLVEPSRQKKKKHVNRAYKLEPEDKNNMSGNHYYRYTRKDEYVVFDSNGYILEAKGYGFLMSNPDKNIDVSLIGKHVDELAEMLKENGVNREVYFEFETQVHKELLKKILKNQKFDEYAVEVQNL